MNKELTSFAARLRELMGTPQLAIGDQTFTEMAWELFELQFRHNPAYRKVCEAGRLTPRTIEHWTQAPHAPTGAFKELELTSIPADERTAVFHSSGTTQGKPSRHFHCAESLALYEASLWAWFEENLLQGRGDSQESLANRGVPVLLTPMPGQAPHSSLVHMCDTVRRKWPLAGAGGNRPGGGGETNGKRRIEEAASDAVYCGKTGAGGAWTLDFAAVAHALAPDGPAGEAKPILLLGTAFGFVHLLDFLNGKSMRLQLPGGSRVMETGGYKNNSRIMPKAELHGLITERLGVAQQDIIGEYGMSELSSQAYDTEAGPERPELNPRRFRFPPWARARVISPENGREVEDGQCGLIRVFDLANVFSVAAIQTEDLGIRRGEGLELIGRAPLAEPRGCSLNSVEA